MTKHKIVIIGGGFGGLYATQALRKSPVQITLLDRRNFHLFQPLLYQVATGTVAPGDIASPLRLILEHQRNASVLWAEVINFNIPDKAVVLEDGTEIPYDTLIIASGSEPNYFGHDQWRTLAPGLKTVEDATAMRSRILAAFESAERESDTAQIETWLTFLVVGAGPTGVELAGALAEIARKTLEGEFRHIRSDNAKIILINADPHVLMGYPEELAKKATQSLQRLGVTVRDNVRVTEVLPDSVVLGKGDQAERIYSRTILWTAGVRASPLGRLVAEATQAQVDPEGRVLLEPDLTIPGHPEIFVIGDLANPSVREKQSLPGVAQVAIQEGRYVADVINRRQRGQSVSPFRYHDKGRLATIGRNSAVADLGWVRLHGFPAWVIWAFVHIYQLLEFENRAAVMMQWAWNYLTWRRTDLLITHAPPSRRKEERQESKEHVQVP